MSSRDRARRAHRPGFTLIESIAAVVILSIAVPSMLWAVRDAGSQRIAPSRTSVARWLATEKLEDIVADRHSLTRGYGYVVDANYPAEAAVAGFTGYGRSVAIAETAADLVSMGVGYKRVTVTVTWTDPLKGARTLNIATVVTDY